MPDVETTFSSVRFRRPTAFCLQIPSSSLQNPSIARSKLRSTTPEPDFVVAQPSLDPTGLSEFAEKTSLSSPVLVFWFFFLFKFFLF